MKHLCILLTAVLLTWSTGKTQEFVSFNNELPEYHVRHLNYLNNKRLALDITDLNTGNKSTLNAEMAKLPNKPTLIVCWSATFSLELAGVEIDSLIALKKDNYNLVLLSVDGRDNNINAIPFNNDPSSETAFASQKQIKQFIYEKKPHWSNFPIYMTEFNEFNNKLSYGIAYAYLILDAQKNMFNFMPIIAGHDYPPAVHVNDYMSNYIPQQKFRSDTLFLGGLFRTANKTDGVEYVLSKANRTKDTITYTGYYAANNGKMWALSIDTTNNAVNGPLTIWNEKNEKIIEGRLYRNGFTSLKKWDDNAILRYDLKDFEDLIASKTFTILDFVKSKPINQGGNNDAERQPLVTLYNEKGKQAEQFLFNKNSGKLAEKKTWGENGNLSEAIIDGITYRYYANGKPSSVIGKNEKGESDGPFKRYFEDGSPDLIATYKNGKRQGEYREYYRNGQLKELSNHNAGVKEGSFVTYHDNGKVQEKAVYKNGEAVGEELEYYRNGNLKERRKSYPNSNFSKEYFYDNGQLFWKTVIDGSANRNEEKIYYPNGNIRAVIRFNERTASCSNSVFYDINGNIIPHKNDFRKAVTNMLSDKDVARIFNLQSEKSLSSPGASDEFIANLNSLAYRNIAEMFTTLLSISNVSRCN